MNFVKLKEKVNDMYKIRMNFKQEPRFSASFGPTLKITQDFYVAEIGKWFLNPYEYVSDLPRLKGKCQIPRISILF